MSNQIIQRSRARYFKATCLSGACWLTWEGGGDVVLSAGESAEVRNVRRLVLEVLRRGQVRIEEAEREGAPARGVTQTAEA